MLEIDLTTAIEYMAEIAAQYTALDRSYVYYSESCLSIARYVTYNSVLNSTILMQNDRTKIEIGVNLELTSC